MTKTDALRVPEYDFASAESAKEIAFQRRLHELLQEASGAGVSRTALVSALKIELVYMGELYAKKAAS